MRRREFITLVGGATAWPRMARAQQTAMPIIGYLGQGGPEGSADVVAAIRRGLGEVGLVEGKDFTSASFAGRGTTPIGCQHWRWIWYNAVWRSLSHSAPR
jgi:hypothetical protein